MLTPPQKSLQLSLELEFFHGTISSLQVFITVPLCVIFKSQNLFICDLRSGQIRESRDLYITSLYGKIMKRVLLRVNDSKPPNSFRIMTYYLICYDPGFHLLTGAPVRVI